MTLTDFENEVRRCLPDVEWSDAFERNGVMKCWSARHTHYVAHYAGRPCSWDIAAGGRLAEGATLPRAIGRLRGYMNASIYAMRKAMKVMPKGERP